MVRSDHTTAKRAGRGCTAVTRVLSRREREREIYFSTVKILAQRPTDISAVATVLLITKTFIVRDRDRQIDR